MNIGDSFMSKSALQKKIDEFGVDIDADETMTLPNLRHLSTIGESPMSGVDIDADETMTLPNLRHLSTIGESPMSGVDHANADVIDERLRQLTGLLESMHLSLDKIAELMAKQARCSRQRTAKKKKSASQKYRAA
jgi:hypothetical protein